MFDAQEGRSEPGGATAARGSAAAAPVAMATADLESEIATLAGHLWAGTARFLVLVAEFDRREAWTDVGIGSCAQWLSWRCGLSPVAAREHVRVARALRALPLVAEAFATGELSYSKVRAITRMATPETEDLLLMWARHGTAAQLERIGRGYRAAKAAEDPDRLHKRRSLTYDFDDEGFLVMRVRLTPENGAVVAAALHAAAAQLEAMDRTAVHAAARAAPAEALSVDPDVPAEAPASRDRDAPDVPAEAPASRDRDAPDVPAEAQRWGVRPAPEDEYGDDLDATSPWERRHADALTALAESFLANGRASLSGPDRAVLSIHVDVASLVDDSGDRCQLSAGPLGSVSAIAAETARRLGCDAGLVRVLDGPDGSPLSIGRKSRIVPRTLRRALRLRDGGCRFPGCAGRADLEAHHIVHWAHGGETSLANLVLLCRKHHRLLHEGGFSVAVRSGSFVFARPNGNVIEIPKTSGSASGLAALGEASRTINADTCASRRDTARPRYDWAVGGLLHLESGTAS